jgi:S-layer protein
MTHDQSTGTTFTQALGESIMATPSSYSTLVQELYVAYFGRPADETGLQNFEAALAAANAPTTMSGLLAAYSTNAAVASLVNSFGTSAESGRLYGTNIAGSQSAAQNFVTAVFESLFNRAPLAGGLAFWSNAITSGSVTPGDAALAIAANAGSADTATILNKVAAATAFTADLASHGDAGLTTYRGATEAGYARAFIATVDGSTTAATYDANAAETVNIMVNGGVPTQPLPTTPPLPPTPVLALTVSGDTIHLSGTTAASTVSLTGADLTTYASGRFGTVAELVAAGVTSVTDSGGNFTLDASGNANATTFNFGTGVVSGADAASGVAITYGGVTTYVTSTHGDTVTLSGATQNVTASYAGNTINLGSLAYAGTLTLNTGPGSNSGGTDTINATVGGDLSHATIVGSNAAKIALVLSSGGTEILTTAEYNTITGTSGGSITFTNGSFGSNQVTFADTGTVTTIANVGNYNLSSVGNHITLTNGADNVTGNASGGTNVVNLGFYTYTGTTAFGTGGTDSIHLLSGADISGGTITSQGATVSLFLSAAGTEKLTAAQYNLFNHGGISGGTPGNNVFNLTTASTALVDSADVHNYILANGANTLAMTHYSADAVTGGSGVDTLVISAESYTGTSDLGGGANLLDVTYAGLFDLSTAAVTATGGTVGLIFDNAAAQDIMLTTAEYNGYATITDGLGSAATSTVTFASAGTVTANASVRNYHLSPDGNTITLTDVADIVLGAASGNDTVNLGGLAFTGTVGFSFAGSDTVDVTVGGDISGGTIYSQGATVALVLNGSGAETMRVNQYNVFNTISIAGGSFADDKIILSDGGILTASANVGNYQLSAVGDMITLNNVADNVFGAASGSDLVDLGTLVTYTGTLAFGATGTATVNATVGGNIGGATITSGGATVALALSGPGTEILSTEEFNLVTAGADAGGLTFTGGAIGSDTITFSDAGVVAAIATVGTYNLSTGGNTIVLDDATDKVNGAASGNDVVDLGSLHYTGTTAFGASGSDAIHVSGGDISGGTITTGGATVGLAFSVAGSETMTTGQYNLFNATGITGGSFGGNTITFTDTGTVSDSTGVRNYHLAATGDSITLNNAGDYVSGAATGGDTINIDNASFTGAVSLGTSGADTLNIDVSSNVNLSGGSISSGGTSANLIVAGSGTLTVNASEAATFHAAASAIAASGTVTMDVTGAGSTINLNAQENALTTVGLQAGSELVNVSIGATSVNGGAAGFNQTISDNGAGSNKFTVDNGSAAIVGVQDATHYVTINNFNVSSDTLVLHMNGVLNSSLSTGPYTSAANANDLASALTAISALEQDVGNTDGYDDAVINTKNGAAVYEVHLTGGTIDGLQLAVVVVGVQATDLFYRIG